MTGSPAMRLEEVSYRYPGGAAPALEVLTLAIPEGRHTAILGPNGAGKSTLLRLLSGVRRPSQGRVVLRERDLTEWRRREIARQIGVVTQEPPPPLPLTVEAFVEMGRHPHLRPWAPAGPVDRRAVRDALERVQLADLAERRISELSGGELQRAKLARCLAQEPRILLLDEPTVHLDMGHEVAFFELIRRLIGGQEITVVTVTHSLHLASRYAEEAVLLAEGRIMAQGGVGDVLQPPFLEGAFGWPVRVLEVPDLGRVVLPMPGPADGSLR